MPVVARAPRSGSCKANVADDADCRRIVAAASQWGKQPVHPITCHPLAGGANLYVCRSIRSKTPAGYTSIYAVRSIHRDRLSWVVCGHIGCHCPTMENDSERSISLVDSCFVFGLLDRSGLVELPQTWPLAHLCQLWRAISDLPRRGKRSILTVT